MSTFRGHNPQERALKHIIHCWNREPATNFTVLVTIGMLNGYILNRIRRVFDEKRLNATTKRNTFTAYDKMHLGQGVFYIHICFHERFDRIWETLI